MFEFFECTDQSLFNKIKNMCDAGEFTECSNLKPDTMFKKKQIYLCVKQYIKKLESFKDKITQKDLDDYYKFFQSLPNSELKHDFYYKLSNSDYLDKDNKILLIQKIVPDLAKIFKDL